MNIKKYIPILEWLPLYKRKDLFPDIMAGLTIGVVVVPSGMAYGMLAGLPPIFGLYAAMVPMFLYGILGTSRQMVIGPAAIIALLVAAGVGPLAEPASEAYIALVLTLTLAVGLIQLLMGALRLGFLVNFLSHPVISGFISAASIIVFFSQLKHLLGIEISRTNFVHRILYETGQNLSSISLPTLLIGLGGIAIILIVRKIHRLLPGPLFAVIFGILTVYFLKLDDAGVSIVKSMESGIPAFIIPDLNLQDIRKLIPVILTITVIGLVESLVIAKALSAKYKDYAIDANQEMRALGISNVAAAFFQAFPAAGSFSRTAVNDTAGGKTGLSSMIGASLVVLTLLFLTPYFYFLPKAILASIIMVAIIKFLDVKEAIHLWKSDRIDFLMLLATFIATLFLGVEPGILVGVILSLLMVLFQTTRPHIAELGKIPGSIIYRSIDRFPEAEQRPDMLFVRFDAQLYFANMNYFKESISKMAEKKGDGLKTILINADSINKIDSSAIHMLKDLAADYHKDGIELCFSGVIGPVRDAMHKGGLFEKMGEDHFFNFLQEAVDHLDKIKPKLPKDYSVRTKENG